RKSGGLCKSGAVHFPLSGNAERRTLAGSSLSHSEAFGSAGLRLSGLFFTILRRRGGLKRKEQTLRHTGNFIDRRVEGSLVGFRRFGKSADFAHELQRSRANFLGSNRRVEIE